MLRNYRFSIYTYCGAILPNSVIIPSNMIQNNSQVSYISDFHTTTVIGRIFPSTVMNFKFRARIRRLSSRLGGKSQKFSFRRIQGKKRVLKIRRQCRQRQIYFSIYRGVKKQRRDRVDPSTVPCETPHYAVLELLYCLSHFTFNFLL